MGVSYAMYADEAIILQSALCHFFSPDKKMKTDYFGNISFFV